MKRLLVALVLLSSAAQADTVGSPLIGNRLRLTPVSAPETCGGDRACIWFDSNTRTFKQRIDDTDSALGGGGSFLPLAGGTMGTGATIGFPGSYSTLSFGQVFPSTDQTTVFKLTPAEAAADSFFINAQQSVVSGMARNDQIANFGWNLNPGGGLVRTGTRRGGIGWSLEDYWEQIAGDVSTAQMEAHLLFVDPTGTQHRPISLLAKLNSPYTTGMYIFDDVIVLGSGPDNNSPASVNITATATIVGAPAGYNKATFDDSGGGGINLQVGSLSAGAGVAQIIMSPSLEQRPV